MRTLSKKMYNGCKRCNQGYGGLRFVGSSRCLGSSVFLGIMGRGWWSSRGSTSLIGFTRVHRVLDVLDEGVRICFGGFYPGLEGTAAI